MHARTELHLIHGGHKGTESVFGEIAEEYGLRETTLSFEGHKVDRAVNVETLDDEELDKGRVSMDFVFQALGRRFASGHGVRRVIHSQFHMVTRCDELFTVGWILENDTVKGGTGWGVELAKLFNRTVHCFDQETNAWYTWDHDEWKRDLARLPEKGVISATGTRTLTDAGRAAIAELFKKSFD